MPAPPLLSGLKSRPIAGDWPSGLRSPRLFLGHGSTPLEVVAIDADPGLGDAAIRAAWKARVGGRATPVVLAVTTADGVRLCGPTGEKPRVTRLEAGQAEQICRQALAAPDRHAAVRLLDEVLATVESDLPGLRNEGFFASHVLRTDAPALPSWEEACRRSQGLRGSTGDALIDGLGFTREGHDNQLAVLRVRTGRKVAVAMHLRQGERPELPAPRFGSVSPISYALTVADRENIPYVLVTSGPNLRLYPARSGRGVGRRAAHETFVEVNPPLLPEAGVGYLWAIFSSDALLESGSVEELLRRSSDFAGDLAKRLRERIYERVVPRLAEGLARARRIESPTAEQLAETFEMALTVLFRLLFIAYAEDRDLLPYRHNEAYRRRSLKTMAKELADLAVTGEAPSAGDRRWGEIQRLFKAVAEGDTELGVPEYDGGLFSSDPSVSPVGSALEPLSLPDSVLRPMLTDLLCIELEPRGPLGPVDFRALGVRDFGTIYEGLLESELALAEQDLTTDKKGIFRPAKPKETLVVRAGDVYLHNRSGGRKATGSYFTKSFVVDHLLERTLVPALDEHCARLDAMDDSDAADSLFDFRVADIAMGSGHFLVAAIDVIERTFRDYLVRRPLAGVNDELARLRNSAAAALRRGEGSARLDPGIDDTQLLRRQIARRCIYGVDLNPMAVNLARLSVWIHTFVPGLPLSLLDHSLVVGNSLVGIGQTSEIEALAPDELASLFCPSPRELIGEALLPLAEMARLADANATEVKVARAALCKAELAAAPAAAFCDIATACRLEKRLLPADLHPWSTAKHSIVGGDLHLKAQVTLRAVKPFHFPVAFPEVFLRDRAGFDVVVGNPPWEKARVEELEFWARHQPGLRALTRVERDSAIGHLRSERPDLTAALRRETELSLTLRDATRHFPGMNSGHPDICRAFLIRIVQSCAAFGGRFGVVVTGDLFKVGGADAIRAYAVQACNTLDIRFATNRRRWLFDDVDDRQLVGVIAGFVSQRELDFVSIEDEVHSVNGWEQLKKKPARRVPLEWIEQYSPTRVLPVIRHRHDWNVMDRLMCSPPIQTHPSIRVRRVYADLETSKADRKYWRNERRQDDVPGYAGESFDIWNGDTGRYYAFVARQDAERVLPSKWRKAVKGSPFAALPAQWRADAMNHPFRRPRIGFRDVTNRTNTRTLIVALIPPFVVTQQAAPWVLWTEPEHPTVQEAFLLACMASRVADWWMRRFAEKHVDQEAFSRLRIPQWVVDSPLVERTVLLAGRLASPDDRFAEWAAKVGVDCGPLAVDEKADMIHELDAVVAHLYGLEESDVVHIFETFHEGWDHERDLAATLRHFRAWSSTR